jgi:hypothetical protein
MAIKQELVKKVLADLGLTKEQILEEGLMDKMRAAGSRLKTAVGNGISTVGAVPANAARNVSNSIANTLQTDKAIINNGVLFVKPGGGFVGLKGIDPNSETSKYLIDQYQRSGYRLAGPEDRMKANTQKIEVVTPQQMTGNLKDTTEKSLRDLAQLASSLDAQIAAKQTVTSQEAGGVWKALNNFIVNGIKQAQAAVGGRQEPHPAPAAEQPAQAPVSQQAPATNPAQAPVSQSAPVPNPTFTYDQTPQGSTAPAPAGTGMPDVGTPGGASTAEVYSGQINQTPWMNNGTFTRLTPEQEAALTPEQKDKYKQAAIAQTRRNTGPLPAPQQATTGQNGPLDFQSSLGSIQ